MAMEKKIWVVPTVTLMTSAGTFPAGEPAAVPVRYGETILSDGRAMTPEQYAATQKIKGKPAPLKEDYSDDPVIPENPAADKPKSTHKEGNK